MIGSDPEVKTTKNNKRNNESDATECGCGWMDED